MCCDIAAHGSHMLHPQHLFKPTTFQFVRDFRISQGRDLPMLDSDGNPIRTNQKQQQGSQQYGKRNSPKPGQYYDNKGKGKKRRKGRKGKGGGNSSNKGDDNHQKDGGSKDGAAAKPR